MARVGMSLQLRLKRSDRVYRPGETVSGMVVCTSERGSPMGHNGITLKVTGTVSMQLSPKNVGLFEAFYASIKPIELMVFDIDVAPAGKLPEGTTELPFEFQMTPVKGQRLFETYHGVYVNIEYRIDCDMPRPRMQKNLRQSLEFMVEIPDAGKPKGALAEKVEFTIDPSSLQNVGKKLQESIASFKIYGYLDSSAFKITDCFSGMIVVEESQAEIESIDMQLTRVESCGSAEAGGQCAKEATEIQSLQLVHGDPCRGAQLPLSLGVYTAKQLLVDLVHGVVSFSSVRSSRLRASAWRILPLVGCCDYRGTVQGFRSRST